MLHPVEMWAKTSPYTRKYSWYNYFKFILITSTLQEHETKQNVTLNICENKYEKLSNVYNYLNKMIM